MVLGPAVSRTRPPRGRPELKREAGEAGRRPGGAAHSGRVRSAGSSRSRGRAAASATSSCSSPAGAGEGARRRPGRAGVRGGRGLRAGLGPRLQGARRRPGSVPGRSPSYAETRVAPARSRGPRAGRGALAAAAAAGSSPPRGPFGGRGSPTGPRRTHSRRAGRAREPDCGRARSGEGWEACGTEDEDGPTGLRAEEPPVVPSCVRGDLPSA